MEYVLHVLITIGIYVILASSFNLVVGYTGLFSIAHAAFYGIGAYASALLTLKFGWSFLGAMAVGLLVAGLLGAAISLPSLRVGGDYLVIASFALQMLVYSVFLNWLSVTRGPMGLPGIPRPEILGWVVSDTRQYLALTALFTIVCAAVVWQTAHSPFGRVLRAIREDEVAARSLAKNVVYFKVAVFILAGALAAVAGSLYAHYVTFINPDSFTLQESIFIFTVVIVGGAGSYRGAILGAAVMIALPESLRFLQVPQTVAGPFRQVLYGALLVFCMRYRPQGFFAR